MANFQNKKQERFVKIMVWILSIVMAGSCATVFISILVSLISG